MVPSDYKLDHVSVRLIERLEGSRLSYLDRPDAWDAAARRIAGEHTDKAIGELYQMWPGPEADAQAALLRQETVESFLPRYLRITRELNTQELGGFGLGPMNAPLGRLVSSAGALLIALMLMRFLYNPLVWLLVGLVALVPVLPELLRWVAYRRYRNDLQELARDMARIQHESSAWLPTEPLSETRGRTGTPQDERVP